MTTDSTQIRRVAIVRPGRSGFELIGLVDGPEPAPAPDWLAGAPSRPRGAERSRRRRRAATRPQPALHAGGHNSAA